MNRLVIRPGAIGDCIVSFPALEWISDPATEVWVPTPMTSLVKFGSGVRSIASTGLDRLAVGDLQPEATLVRTLSAFDSITSWYGTNRPEFREALLQINPNTTFFPALPSTSESIHAVDFYCAQVGAPMGQVPRISLPSMPSRHTAAIHPFSGGKRKDWPKEQFEELANRIPIGCEWIVGPEQDWPGATFSENLAELAIFLKGASIYVGNDSGISHLAAAIGMPVVAIFIASDPRVWAPRGDVTVLQNPAVSEVVEVIHSILGRTHWQSP